MRSQTDPASVDAFGLARTLHLSDSGGLTLFGVHHQTLEPGARTSDRHWHEREDEFLYVLAGKVTVIEEDGAHTLAAGDAAAWPAGVANAHTVENRSAAPCSFLVIGTRPERDVCHYPDLGRRLETGPDGWRIVEVATGAVLRSGSL